MRIGIISDTHGKISNTHRAVEVLRQEDVEVVIHCGDVGTPGVVAQFMDWPTHFVAGNCDDSALLKAEVIQANQQWHGLFGDFQLNHRRIAVLHSHKTGVLEETVQSGKYDLVCYGHTHLAEWHQAGSTLVVNPGALHRASCYSVAVVCLSRLTAEHIEVEC